MPLTTKATLVADYMIDTLLEPSGHFDPRDVYYGDSDQIPRVPAVTVEPGNKARQLVQTGLQADVLFEVNLMVYLCNANIEHDRQRQADALAETVEDLINSDRTMGGLVINGFIETVEQGFALRSGETLKAARLTWQGRSKHQIGA